LRERVLRQLQRQRGARRLHGALGLSLRPAVLSRFTLAPHLLGAVFMKKTKRTATGRSSDEVMARYAAGDDAVFAELYRLVTPGLTRFIDRRLGDKAKLPDLVQETMFRVHRARGSFARGAAVMPWVLGIARRQLIDEYRSTARWARTERIAPLTIGSATGSPPNGEEMVAAKQTAECLDRAFAAVPGPQRAALRLVRGEGLSHAEAARVLGTSPLGVRLRTHRACRALREALTSWSYT
jgi:RNA polymerase sigma-70 factor, ECF subfamily